MKRLGTITLMGGAIVLAMLVPAGASATTFCVPAFHAACTDDGENVSEPDLETAINTNSSDRVDDKVYLAPGDYTESDPLTRTGGGDVVRIYGEGSTLTSTSTEDSFVIDVSGTDNAVVIKGLKVIIPSSFPDGAGGGIKSTFSEFDGVDIESHNPGSTGFVPVGFSNYSHARMYGVDGGDFTYGVRAIADGGTNNDLMGIVGATIEDAEYAVASESNFVEPIVQESFLEPRRYGIWLPHGASVDLVNSVIEAGSEEAIYALGGTEYGQRVLLENSTIVNKGRQARPAMHLEVPADGTADMYAPIMDSIIWGFETPYVRLAPKGGKKGNVGLMVQNTDLNLDGVVSKGDGYLEFPGGNEYFDPRFVNEAAGDYRLRPDSPSIDHWYGPVQEYTDILGNPRPVDGDGNGTKILDQGAYEFQRAPDRKRPQITKVELKNGRKKSLGIRYSLSERAKVRFRFTTTIKTRKGKRKRVSFTRVQKGQPGFNSYRVGSKWLKQNHYRLLITATDYAGNESRPRFTSNQFGVSRFTVTV